MSRYETKMNTLSRYTARCVSMQAFAEMGHDPVAVEVANASRFLQESIGPDLGMIPESDIKLLAITACRLAMFRSN